MPLHHGDLFDVLPTLAANSVDACVTDPPYDLTANKRGGSGAASINLESPYGRARIGTGNGAGGFMGKKWDGTGVAFTVETWREVYRVLKPGAHLVAFGGTRTFHRMTCAIEDAGFEIRDCLSWLYGSGFPKSKNVALSIDKGEGHPNRGHRIATANRHHPDGTFEPNGETLPAYQAKSDAAKQWEGWGTALKPAWEPIILARKHTLGTVAATVLGHGTGALNIDACRLEGEKRKPGYREPGTPHEKRGSVWDEGSGFRNKPFGDDLGRWPANVLLDEEAAALLDEQSGELTSGAMRHEVPAYAGESVTGFLRGRSGPSNQHGGRGGASRFYYVAKPSREERDYGMRSQPRGNHHPTVKPVELMRWLVKLVAPIGGTVLDPFTGSGTTGMACRYEQRGFIGIEREAEYVAIAERRIAAVAPLFGEATA